MKFATFLPFAACSFLAFLPTSSSLSDQQGILTIMDLNLINLSAKQTQIIQECVAMEFHHGRNQREAIVEATLLHKKPVKTTNASLRRGLNTSHNWLYDFFFTIFFNGCRDCLAHDIDDDMLFRKLSSADLSAENICVCIQTSGNPQFTKIEPDDCSVEFNEVI